MANFHLEIVSMDGQQFSGEVERVVFRSIASKKKAPALAV